MGKNSQISENEGYKSYVTLFFGNSWSEHCVLREEDGSSRISENEGYILPTDSSGGNKHVSGFSHTCVENGKHLQTYNCVAFFTHVCLFPYICVKIQTCVENST